jgi:hypothetical protein
MKSMTGNEASKLLNELRCKLFTDNLKGLINRVRIEQPEKCFPSPEKRIPEKNKLNARLKEIASLPEKNIESMQAYLSPLPPYILSQIFDRFLMADIFYRNNRNKQILVEEQELDFLIQSLAEIACTEEASSNKEE